MSAMDDARHASLSAYVREAADLLGLRDWDVRVLRAVAETGAHRAEITLHRQKDEAVITLSEAWFGRTAQERRQTIVHELLHMHTARLCRVCVVAPSIEVADHRHRFGVRRPQREAAAVVSELATELAVQLRVRAFAEEVDVLVAETVAHCRMLHCRSSLHERDASMRGRPCQAAPGGAVFDRRERRARRLL